MTGLPLARVLDGLALPEPVMHALLNRTGLFEPFMALTEACEAANDEAFATHADSLLLSGHQVNMAHLQALAWAEDLLAT
jgi:c-di-GMP-related signal transduction protein